MQRAPQTQPVSRGLVIWGDRPRGRRVNTQQNQLSNIVKSWGSGSQDGHQKQGRADQGKSPSGRSRASQRGRRHGHPDLGPRNESPGGLLIWGLLFCLNHDPGGRKQRRVTGPGPDPSLVEGSQICNIQPARRNREPGTFHPNWGCERN